MLFTLASHFEVLAQQPSYLNAIRLLWGATAMGLNLFLSEQQLQQLSQKAQSNTLTKEDQALVRTGMHRLVKVLGDLKNSMPMLEKAVPLTNRLV